MNVFIFLVLYASDIFLNYFHLLKGRITLIRPETIIGSLLHLNLLICRIFLIFTENIRRPINPFEILMLMSC